MIPGPVYIIPCPVCTFPGKKNSFLSGNTFGAELWSDGKKVAPMLPEYPYLVKCKKCGSFFLTDENHATGKYFLRANESDKWPDVEFFEFPSFTEYFEAIGTDVISEKYIRKKAFYSYNDLIRAGKAQEITIDMRDLYFDNLKSLLYLLSDEEPDEIFSLIEINRQLGRFEKCKELLDKIDDNDGGEFKKLFAQEIEKKNARLFRLN
jgi:hypothetical protein